MSSSAARLPVVKCHIPQAMLDRLVPLAEKAGSALGRTVERAAVIRAAITAWLHHTKNLPIPELGRAIRVATRVTRGSNCRRVTVRWTENTARCLVERAHDVRPWLGHEPPPTALVRAALAFWIDTAELCTADVLAQEILPAIELRGRKKETFPRTPN